MFPTRFITRNNTSYKIIEHCKKSMTKDNFKIFLDLFIDYKLQSRHKGILNRIFGDIIVK